MTNGKFIATIVAIANSLIAQIRTIGIVAGAILGAFAIISLFFAQPLVTFLHLVSFAGLGLTLFAVAVMILTFRKAREMSSAALVTSLVAALASTFVSLAFAHAMPSRILVVLALAAGGALGVVWSRTTLFFVDGKSIRMCGTVWYLAVWALTLVVNQAVTILTGRPPVVVAVLALLGAGLAIGNTAGLILRAQKAAAVVRVALAAFVVCGFALSTPSAKADDGVWVLQRTSSEVSGIGPGVNTCEASRTGNIGDGNATFTQTYQARHCRGWDEEPGKVVSRCVWQSPPQRLAPQQKVLINATVSHSIAAVGHDNSPYESLQVVVDAMFADQVGISARAGDLNAPRSDSKTKALTFTPAEGGNYEEVVEVMCQTAGGSGTFLYHYAYQAGGAVAASDAPASGSPGNTGKLAITAVAAVLGGLLVSLGAAIAAGLSGIGQSDVTSTLTGILKGTLPGDGFDDWKNKASGKVYGTGAPDDPYRDYPDTDNPPWKAPYGDGTAAHPYSDTPPPAIEAPVFHVSAALGAVNASSDDLSAGPSFVKEEHIPAPIDKLVKIEPLGESTQDTAPAPVPDAPSSPEDHIDRYGEPDAVNYQEFYDNGAKLDQTSKKLQEVVDQLKSEGYFIANPSEPEFGPLHVPVETLVKIWHNVPHRAGEFADWLKSECTSTIDPSVWSDPQSPYYKSDPAEREELEKALHGTIADPHWGQCEEAVGWGRDRLEKSIGQIFGPDAVFTQISIGSNVNDNANHVANEVILPNGERYVVDVWASMVDGKPRIYREDKWLEKWKNDTWVGMGGTTVVRGAPGKELEGQLESHIRDDGVEDGIKKLRVEAAKHASDGGKSLETVIKSYRAYPWPTKPPEAPPTTPHTPGMSGKFRM